jgi:hypothetical protein
LAFTPSNPIGEGTDAELLVYARAAIVQILTAGKAYGINGRTLTREDLPAITKLVEWLEARVDADAGTSTRNLATLKRSTSAARRDCD